MPGKILSEEDQLDESGQVYEAPSIGSDPNFNPESFSLAGDPVLYQTIVPSGVLTKDQVFATEKLEDTVPEGAIDAYKIYLVNSRQVKAPGGLSDTELGINQKYIDKATENRTKALNAIAGTSFTEEDLITAAKQREALSPTSASVRTADTDFVSPSVVNTEGNTIPVDEGVYAYQIIDLYDDRYDFETGKKIRVGVAGGVAGGAGDPTTQGNTEENKEQLEPIVTPSGPR